jgi:hypothetical protein
MNDDAGGVDDGPQRTARLAAQRACREGLDRLRRVRDGIAGGNPRPQPLGPRAQRGDRRVRTVPRLECLHGGTLPKYLDAGNNPEIRHLVNHTAPLAPFLD